MDATEYLKNWDDVECDYKRSSMGGIVRSFTSKFEFIGKAYDALFNALVATRMNISAVVTIYLRTESWEWEELFSAVLDASTIEFDGTTFSMSAYDNDVASKLNAKKGTKYQYPVSELDTELLTFERLKMNNWETYTLAPSKWETYESQVSSGFGWFTLPLYQMDSSVNVRGALEFIDQEGELVAYQPNRNITEDSAPARNDAENAYFCIAKRNTKLRVRLALTLKNNLSELKDVKVKLGLYAFKSDGTWLATLGYEQAGIGQRSVSLVVDQTVTLEEGQYVSLLIGHSYVDLETLMRDYHNEVEAYKYDINDWTARFDWEDIGEKVTIDCLKPITLLNKLLFSMCGEGITGLIDNDAENRLTNCRLVPAESARAIADAYVYSSFTNFCNFMEALFGYVYHLEGNVVHFCHRDTLFSADGPKQITAYSDFSVQADAGMTYSTIEIGHDAVDYDEDNGRKEFNFKQTYNTGFIFSNNTLSLDPSYRVDGYGLEYLVEKRADDGTDDDSDDAVFAVLTDGNTGYLKPDRSTEIRKYVDTSGTEVGEGVSGFMYLVDDITGDGYINAKYHPYFCAQANKAYLATFADTLLFASSDGASNIAFNGIPCDKDIIVGTERKYTPLNLSFKTNSIALPSAVNGLISLKKDGVTYSGWMSSLKLHSIKTKEASYKVILSAGFYGGPDPDDGGDTEEGVTIYVRAGLKAASGGKKSVYILASRASEYEYKVRAKIGYNDASSNPVTEYVLYTVAPGTTAITGQSYNSPYYIEFVAFQGADDPNTYITSFVNREMDDDEDVSATDLVLSGRLTYYNGKDETKIYYSLDQQAPEDIAITTTISNPDTGSSQSVTVTIGAGSTSASLVVSGCYKAMTEPPTYGVLQKSQVTWNGYKFFIVDTADTEDETSEYEPPVITSVDVADVNGSGTSTVNTAIVYYTQVNPNGVTESGNTQVSFSDVRANGVGSTTERTALATRTITVTVNGKTSASYTFTVYQAQYVPGKLTLNLSNEYDSDVIISNFDVGSLHHSDEINIPAYGTLQVISNVSVGSSTRITVSGTVLPTSRFIEADMQYGTIISVSKETTGLFSITASLADGASDTLTVTFS